MDRAADRPWTRQALRADRRPPGVVSTELAAAAGQERAYFKLRVRRLKALGLTESLEIGYRLSPRGAAYWLGADDSALSGRRRNRPADVCANVCIRLPTRWDLSATSQPVE